MRTIVKESARVREVELTVLVRRIMTSLPGRAWIEEPKDYLSRKNREQEDTYEVSVRELAGVGCRMQADFEQGASNCTLTALLNVLIFYRENGWAGIRGDDDYLYARIREQADRLHYSARRGIPVTKNDNLVKDTLRAAFGYPSGKATDRYLWTRRTALSEIDRGRPFLFSLASGVYFNHTVTVWGYVQYRNIRTAEEVVFLGIYDGWSSRKRYLPWTHTGVPLLGCMTFVSLDGFEPSSF